MKVWYYQLDGTIFGPVSSAELMKLAKTGVVLPASLIRSGEEGKWLQASRVQRLFSPQVHIADGAPNNTNPTIKQPPQAVGVEGLASAQSGGIPSSSLRRQLFSTSQVVIVCTFALTGVLVWRITSPAPLNPPIGPQATNTGLFSSAAKQTPLTYKSFANEFPILVKEESLVVRANELVGKPVLFGDSRISRIVDNSTIALGPVRITASLSPELFTALQSSDILITFECGGVCRAKDFIEPRKFVITNLIGARDSPGYRAMKPFLGKVFEAPGVGPVDSSNITTTPTHTPEKSNEQVRTFSVGDAIDKVRQAAQSGDSQAMFYLGTMYTEGIGVERNQLEAYTWIMLSGIRGYGPARDNVEGLEQFLPPQQFAFMRKRATDLGATIPKK